MKGKFNSMWRVSIALVLALSLSLVMAAPVSAAGALTNVSATPDNDMAGATTTYPIVFTPATTYVIDSVEIEFATGFDVSGATLGTVSGIGDGTVSSSGLVMTYSMTESELLDSGDIDVTINLSGIVNPADATYTPGVTVRTMSGTTTIDEGTADVTIIPAPVSFLVAPSGTVTAGAAFSVDITARAEADGGGADVTGYTGLHLIDFSSTASDPKTIPDFAVINFTAGVGTSLTEFVLNVVETGKTITATDSEINVTGTSSEITVGVAVLGYLVITGAPASVTAGEAFVSDVTVTAYDAEGNASDDTSTVSWTSTDTTATAGSGLPTTPTALTAGTATFDAADFTLKEAGSQTITVTGGGISGDAFITVNPAAADSLTVAVDPAAIDADGSDASTITATVEDEFLNVDTNYTASVTFATSLGTLSDVSANFVAGVATATLTSDGVVGEATILVTSGTLSDTETVALDSALLAEVWVAIDGSDTNPGTETSPVKTILDAIAKVAAGGTVNVGPGTYEPSATIDIPNTKDGLTLRSTDGVAVTTIVYDGDVIQILNGADDVTVEDFTIDGVSNTSGSGILIIYGTEGATVLDNIITNANHAVHLTYDYSGAPTVVVVGATVSGNVIEDCDAGISLQGAAKDCTIADNTITDCTGRGIALTAGTTADPTQGNAITGNTITGCGDRGIWVKEGGAYDGTIVFFDDNLIDGNTVSGGEFRGIQIAADDGNEGRLDITNLVITRNNVTGNIGGGILVDSWEAGGGDSVINFNNITGNTDYDIVVTVDPGDVDGDVIDATQNWWGSVVGAEIHRMISEDAALEEDDFDYGSWLNAPHAIPDITLATGWNLISLPLIPTDSDIDTVLADLTEVIQVRTFVDDAGTPSEQWWLPGVPTSTLSQVVDGQGYWIEMSEESMLAVTGVELALPGQVPPTYNVVVGWNLIGFTGTSTQQADVYLGSVKDTLEAMYGYNAVTGLYQNILTDTLLVPGNGYWLAVNTAGKIYP